MALQCVFVRKVKYKFIRATPHYFLESFGAEKQEFLMLLNLLLGSLRTSGSKTLFFSEKEEFCSSLDYVNFVGSLFLGRIWLHYSMCNLHPLSLVSTMYMNVYYLSISTKKIIYA